MFSNKREDSTVIISVHARPNMRPDVDKELERRKGERQSDNGEIVQDPSRGKPRENPFDQANASYIACTVVKQTERKATLASRASTCVDGVRCAIEYMTIAN